MTRDEHLHRYGLPTSHEHLPAVRHVLQMEVDPTTLGSSAEETDDLALLCCVQLFSKAQPEDILRIWAAKQSSFDKACSVDIQLLCGMGLEETKAFLNQSAAPRAAEALADLQQCEAAGDFEGFSPEEVVRRYREYFGAE